jgi:hypothetical protein
MVDMDEITVKPGDRVRLMVRMAPDTVDDPAARAITGLHGDILFKNTNGDGMFTVVGGPARVLEDGDAHIVLMLNGTAEGGVGRYEIERIQLAMPHRSPFQMPKDDPLFRSFAISIAASPYPRVVDIQERPEDIEWAEDPDVREPAS